MGQDTVLRPEKSHAEFEGKGKQRPLLQPDGSALCLAALAKQGINPAGREDAWAGDQKAERTGFGAAGGSGILPPPPPHFPCSMTFLSQLFLLPLPLFVQCASTHINTPHVERNSLAPFCKHCAFSVIFSSSDTFQGPGKGLCRRARVFLSVLFSPRCVSCKRLALGITAADCKCTCHGPFHSTFQVPRCVFFPIRRKNCQH